MKVIAIYDNKGTSLDRYTVLIDSRRRIGSSRKYMYECLSADENGRGVFMWDECMKGKHLGIEVKLTDLSKELQDRIALAIH